MKRGMGRRSREEAVPLLRGEINIPVVTSFGLDALLPDNNSTLHTL